MGEGLLLGPSSLDFANKQIAAIKNPGFVQFVCSPIRDLVGACSYPGFAEIEVALIKLSLEKVGRV